MFKDYFRNFGKRHLVVLAILLFIITATFYYKSDIFYSGEALYQKGLIELKQGDQECYFEDGTLESAISYFETAIQKGFINRDVFDKLSYCYIRSEDNKSAEITYTKGLKYFPNDLDFYYFRGDCRKELKNYFGAYMDYNKVISLGDNTVYYSRGAMQYILGDTIRANKDFIKAEEIIDNKLRPYFDYCKGMIKTKENFKF